MDRERWHSAAGRAWRTCRALPGEVLAFLAECARDHRVRPVLLWCIPALACGLAARLVLMGLAPCAVFNSDTRGLIDAAENFLRRPWAVFGGGTRTFLMPVLYSVPLALKQPLLPWVAAGQHLVGLAAVPATGLLCAAWLRQWRWWIIPVTMVPAIHPTILWWEHMALPDSLFLVLSLAVCVAVVAFSRRPNRASFALIAGTVILAAGARQEGFLLLGSLPLICAAVFWGDWARIGRYVAASAALAALVMAISRTGQGGQMLLTSVIHMAPDHLSSEPGFSSRAAALRDRFAPSWPVYPDDHNASRKEIVAQVQEHLMKERGLGAGQERALRDRFCKRVAKEIALRNLHALPGLAWHKFLATHLDEPSPRFDTIPAEMVDEAFDGKELKELPYLRRLFGRNYARAEDFQRDVETRYYPAIAVPWLTRWQDAWTRITLRQGDKSYIRLVGPPGHQQRLPMLPPLYAPAALGLVLLALMRGKSWPSLPVWLLTLLGVAFVTLLTGSLRARYRLMFEPYWYIGWAGLLDAAVTLVGRIRSRVIRRSP
ncbi:MAG TPA: hypothetical protein PLU30_18225 [Verrucomicrobiae bacterium]|nr:hypothetical protein [Verrucomicrobiae bacterium]